MTTFAKTEYTEDIKRSASGGVFYFLASYFIEKGGTVFGAVFDQNFNVKHTCAGSMDAVRPMQNSKYVQSDSRGVYKEVKSILDSDPEAYVLFSGTPCQCSGLKSYLRKDYKNLLTADMVCHGVPSPLAFEKYLRYLSVRNKEAVKDYQFRYKLKGWNYRNFMSSYVKFNNNFWPVVHDPYMSAFLSQSDYRECCYSCEYNTTKKAADVTMADFVGVRDIAPDFYSPVGCSELYIHNQKGFDYLENIQPFIECFELSLKQMKGYGKVLKEPRVRKPIRDRIYKDITTMSDKDFVEQRLRETISPKRIVRFYTPLSVRRFFKH